MEASIDKYSKQANRIKAEEMSKSLIRLNETSKLVSELKSQVHNMDSNDYLLHYIGKKDTEVENCKLLIKAAHVGKICSILLVDFESCKKAAVLSSEIIQVRTIYEL